MNRPARSVLATLAASIAASAALVTPASTAGVSVDPNCNEDPDLSRTSRHYMGTTFSLIRAYTRYCDNRLDRAVNDMTQVAGDAWSVNFIASRCERDMINRMDPYLDYINRITEDIMLDHYNNCPQLFNTNLAFNSNAPGIMSRRFVNFRNQLDGAIAAYATGDSFDAPTVNPGVRRGTFPGGGLSR